MPLKVYNKDICKATGKGRSTANRWTSSLPKTESSPARFDVVHILPLLTPEEAERLLACAVDDGSQWVGGDDMLPVAERLCAWIERHADMKQRLHASRVTFFNALASTVRTGLLVSDTERLRVLLVLSQHLLPFIVTGDKRGLPSFAQFAPAFAMIHTARPYASELVSAA